MDLETLIDESNEYLIARNERMKSEFGISEYPRYDWDQWRGELVFSRDGIPGVVGRIQFVGSVSTRSNTWLWAWANSSYVEPVRQASLRVREYGERAGVPKFTEAKWPAEEVDGWEMTAVTARFVGAKGGYRTPGDEGFTYMVLTDLSQVTDRKGIFRTYACAHVVDDSAPILLVEKATDGDVRLQCGAHPGGDYLAIHQSDFLDADSTLVPLADLPLGWRAKRDVHGAPWTPPRIE
jgi:hypothetical protein